MEKKYIIFTPNISYIGGAQLYVRNKCRYVEKKGWNPIIIAGNANNIMIKDLKKYLYIEENEINDPFLERKKQLVFRLMRFLNKHINKGDFVQIESHNLYPCVWAEIIAKEYKALNMLYLLEEPNLKGESKEYVSFLKYKIRKKQLLMISNKSAEIIFGKKYTTNNSIQYLNVPFDDSEIIDDCDLKLHNYLKKVKNNDSILILTVSRLEKNYIKKLIKDVTKLSKKSKKKLTLLVIGSSKNKKLVRYYKNFEINNNKLCITFWGFLTPLCKELFLKADIFVGMGTSLINAASQGCPSIGVDPRTNKSSGFFGVNLFNFAYSELEQQRALDVDLLYALSDSIFLEKAGKAAKDLYLKEYELNGVMDKFFRITNDAIEEKPTYYIFKDFTSIKILLRKFNLYYKLVNLFKG